MVFRKRNLIIVLLSLAWVIFLLYPYVMGMFFCSVEDLGHTCVQSEGGGPYWFGYNLDYAPGIVVRNLLFDLSLIHKYLSPLKYGVYLVAVACIPLGWLTYWIIEKVGKKWHARGSRGDQYPPTKHSS